MVSLVQLMRSVHTSRPHSGGGGDLRGRVARLATSKGLVDIPAHCVFVCGFGRGLYLTNQGSVPHPSHDSPPPFCKCSAICPFANTWLLGSSRLKQRNGKRIHTLVHIDPVATPRFEPGIWGCGFRVQVSGVRDWGCGNRGSRFRKDKKGLLKMRKIGEERAPKDQAERTERAPKNKEESRQGGFSRRRRGSSR